MRVCNEHTHLIEPECHNSEERKQRWMHILFPGIVNTKDIR